MVGAEFKNRKANANFSAAAVQRAFLCALEPRRAGPIARRFAFAAASLVASHRTGWFETVQLYVMCAYLQDMRT